MRTTSSDARRPDYISPGSQSLEIDVLYGTAAAVGAQLNLAPLPASCTVTGGVAQCAIAVVAQASATGFTITFFDQPNSQGDVLSTVSVPVPVAVDGVANVAATLQPVAASLVLAPATTLIQGIPGSTTLTFTAVDAAGNPIAGTTPFSAPIVLVPSSPAITFSPNTIANPSTPVTVTYSGAAGTSPQITATTGKTSFTTQLPIAPAGTSPAFTITPAEIGVQVGAAGVPINVSLPGSSGSVTLADTCVNGAAISLSQTSVPAGPPVAVMVQAVTAPSGNPAHACTITGTAAAQSISVLVDVAQNTFNVNAIVRHSP